MPALHYSYAHAPRTIPRRLTFNVDGLLLYTHTALFAHAPLQHTHTTHAFTTHTRTHHHLCPGPTPHTLPFTTLRSSHLGRASFARTRLLHRLHLYGYPSTPHRSAPHTTTRTTHHTTTHLHVATVVTLPTVVVVTLPVAVGGLLFVPLGYRLLPGLLGLTFHHVRIRLPTPDYALYFTGGRSWRTLPPHDLPRSATFSLRYGYGLFTPRLRSDVTLPVTLLPVPLRLLRCCHTIHTIVHALEPLLFIGGLPDAFTILCCYGELRYPTVVTLLRCWWALPTLYFACCHYYLLPTFCLTLFVLRCYTLPHRVPPTCG